MIKYSSALLFLIGAALIVWVGAGFAGTHPLAFWVTVAIGIFYLAGYMELVRFQGETGRLEEALSAADRPVEALDGWLAQLPAGLQTAVRLRIRGEPVSLPMPVLTPYLTGLLVMLGLLGTFVGMVVSLQGAVVALEGTTELAAIRRGLTAPIAGLSMAFGTSVAGVAGSAVLGLISALSRRQRLMAVRTLDGRMATAFQSHSRRHYEAQMLEHSQTQARQLPEVVGQLTSLTERLDGFVQNLDDRLVSGQQQFHDQMLALHTELARSVGDSLRGSLTESGRQVGESVRPVLVEAVAGLAREAGETQQQMRDTAAQQAASLDRQLQSITTAVRDIWQESIHAHQRVSVEMAEQVGTHLQQSGETFTANSDRLVVAVDTLSQQAAAARQADSTAQVQLDQLLGQLDTLAQTLAQRAEHQGEALAGMADDARQQVTALAQALARSAEELQQRLEQGQHQLAERMAESHRALSLEVGESLKASIANNAEWAAETLTPLVQGTLDGVNESVSRTQQALAAATQEQLSTVASQLDETARNVLGAVDGVRADAAAALERDQTMLQEHRSLLTGLAQMTAALEQDAGQYRAAVEELTANSTRMLADATARFDDQVGTGSTRLVEASDNFSASAIELATLGESMFGAVDRFEQANQQLQGTLSQIERSMGESAQRSDEQLAYYVAQAREVIDHSATAQQQLIEQMRLLNRSS